MVQTEQARNSTHEVARLEALRRYELLDTPPEGDFDYFTIQASELCGTPISLITLIDDARQWFKSKVGLATSQIPREIAFCNYTIQGHDIFEVSDATQDPRFCGNPLVTDSTKVRFYAGVPLKSSDGFNIGTLCVLDRIPRRLSADQRIWLARMSRQVITRVELRLSNRLLQTEVDLRTAMAAELASALKELKQKKELEEERLQVKVRKSEEALVGSEADSKQAHSQLQESLSRYRFLADTMPQIVWTTHANGNADYFNQRWFDYTGMTLDQTKNWGWTPVLHPEDLPHCLEKWMRSLAAGSDYEVEYRLKRFDGSYRWHLGRGFPLRNEKDEIIQWVGSCTDIDEQKRVNLGLERRVEERTKELRAAKSGLQGILDAATKVGIIATNEQGLIKLFNRGAEQMFGYSSEEVIGKCTPAVLHLESEVVERGIQMTKELGREVHGFEVFVDKVRRGEHSEDEWTLKRKDGTQFSANLILTAVRNLEGELTGFLGIVTDISFRKKAEETLRHSEERFHLIVDALKDHALFMLDCDGKVVSWNTGAERIKGYSADEIIGENFSKFYPPEAVMSGHLKNELALAARDGRYTEEGYRVRKDGSRFLADVTITAIHNDSGELQGFAKVTRDITERKRAENQLAQSLKETQDFKTALDEAAIVAITDPQGKILYANNRFCEISKYSRNELIGQDHRIINSGFHSRQFIRDLWTTISSGQVWRGEVKNRAKDGTFYWVDTTIVPLLDAEGNTRQYLSIRTEITKRKVAEEKLLAQALMLDLAHDSILIRDQDDRITYWNQGAERLYGWTKNEALGKITHSLFNTKFPKALSEISAQVLDEGHWEGELIHTRRDGSIIIVASRSTLQRDPFGHPMSIIEMNYDITDRKRAEEQLRASEELFREAFVNSATGFALIALNGNWKTVNPILLDLLGYPEEELLGTTFQALTHPDDLELSLKHARRLNSGEINNYQIEKRYIHKSGRIIWALLNISLAHHADGTPAHFIAQIQDVTERHRSQELIRNALEEKEVLLREIHHRVKNNMQVISSLLHLQRGYLHHELDDKIFEDCQYRIRSMALVHERLYSSTSLASIDFAEYLNDLSELIFQGQSKTQTQVNLQRQCEAVELGIDTAIPLGLVANEMISNAFKHAFAGRVSGTITLILKKEGGLIQFTVLDDGVGFPDEIHARQKKSLGMRLIDSLSRQIRAKLTFVNQPGGGSRVDVIFATPEK